MQHGAIRGKVIQRFLPRSTHTPFKDCRCIYWQQRFNYCRFHWGNERTSIFCFSADSRKVISLINHCFVHNIHAEILKALSMQVEVSSNKYHLLWGSVIGFHMERIHIKLTCYQRKIDNKINIQFNLTGTTL